MRGESEWQAAMMLGLACRRRSRMLLATPQREHGAGQHPALRKANRAMRHAHSDDLALSTVIENLGNGTYLVPDFQRDFVWDADGIRELLRSMFQDYYIGSLLLWEGSSTTQHELDCTSLFGKGGADLTTPAKIVLDGQQRLTAMHYAFFAPNYPLPSKEHPDSFFLQVDEFMSPEAEPSARGAAFLRRERNATPSDIGTVDDGIDEEVSFRTHEFPMALMSRDFERNQWIIKYQEFWQSMSESKQEEARRYAAQARDHAAAGREAQWEANEREAQSANSAAADARRLSEQAKEFGGLITRLMGSYRVSTLELDQGLDVDSVSDIFSQINRQGKKLTNVEMLNGVLAIHGIRFKRMVNHAKDELSKRGLLMSRSDADIVRMMLLRTHPESRYEATHFELLVPGRRSSVASGESILIKTPDDFETKWEEATNAMIEALQTLKDETHFGSSTGSGVTEFLRFEGMIPVYCEMWRRAKGSRKRLALVRQWYWASVLTERYFRTESESVGSRDCREMEAAFAESGQEPSAIRDFKLRFGPGQIHASGIEGQRSLLYRAVLGLFFSFQPLDWTSGKQCDGSELVDVPIVSAAWCGVHGVQKDLAESVFNLVLVDRQVQNVMEGKLPNAFMPEMFGDLREEVREKILRSHCLSVEAYEVLLRNPFGPADYEEFIELREQEILRKLGDQLYDVEFCVEPEIRQLERRVSAIERSLRDCIADTLVAAGRDLPDHVKGAIEKRIRDERKRQPGMARGGFQSIRGRLEFSDLRDLETVVEHDSTWPLFEKRFVDKPAFKRWFAALADFRNADAHNRTAGNPVVKAGEGAVSWFEEASAGC